MSSSDIAKLETYPGNSPEQVPPGNLRFEVSSGSRLEERAVRLGTALGRITLLLRNQKDIAERKLSLVTEDATSVINQRADQLKAKAEEVSQLASTRAQEFLNEAERQTEALRQRAVLNIRRARLRAQEFQRDYPERVAVGAGILGVALGVGLRIWRANRA